MATVISNPPYNMKWDVPVFAQTQSRFFDYGVPPKSNANYAFILTAIEKSQKAIFLLPNGVLSTDNISEKDIRKRLIEKNYIQGVILLPDRMFEATSIPTCILILDKNKQTTDVMMIDMRQTYVEEIRYQNGQYGGTSHENRTYEKKVKAFSDENIKMVIDIIAEKKDVENISRKVTQVEIMHNDCILTPSRYIEFGIQEQPRRSYEDIVADLNRIIKKRNVLKLTINETVAKSLGLQEIIAISRETQANNRGIATMLHDTFNLDLEREDYISVSKNKNEIKFENNSKDEISHIFMMIMQSYKQHIYYLNEEENRYLIELRDKLLPDLMSGKIEI